MITESSQPNTLRFGQFQIDLQHQTLLRGTKRIPIQRKPLAVLTYLIQSAPRIVHREELLKKFWSNAVNEESLTRCISTIRAHLGDSKDPPEIIETCHGQGYRFVATLSGSVSDNRLRDTGAWLRRGYFIAVLAILGVIFIWATKFPFHSDPSAQTSSLVNRLAVLPVIVEIPDEPWLGGALSENVMHALSKIEGITVVATDRADPDIAPEEIISQLKVDAFLSTRLERLPNGSRLSARLLSAMDGQLLWQSSFESQDTTISSTQVEDLARQVALRLRPTLQLREDTKQIDEKAYAFYLRGRYYLSQRSAVGLRAAIEAFNKALEISPDYVDATLGTAESWLLLPLYGAMPPLEATPTARSLALEALDADPHNARARAVLGVIAMQFDWDWLAAESLLREAVALNPNDATAQQWLGELYCYRSYFEKCRQRLQIALDLDPLSPVLAMQQGSPALYSGDYNAAITAYEAATRNTPEYALGQYALGLARAGLNDWQEAVAAYQASLPDLGLAIVGGPMIYALTRNGQIDTANEMMQRLLDLSLREYVPPSKLAVAYLGVGDKEQAISSLQTAVELHDDRLIYFANDVHFRQLMNDAQFRSVAEQVGLRTRSE